MQVTPNICGTKEIGITWVGNFTLAEMASKPRARQKRSLEVDVRMLLQGAEIRAAQGFGGYAEFEGGRGGEGGYREAGSWAC